MSFCDLSGNYINTLYFPCESYKNLCLSVCACVDLIAFLISQHLVHLFIYSSFYKFIIVRISLTRQVYNFQLMTLLQSFPLLWFHCFSVVSSTFQCNISFRYFSFYAIIIQKPQNAFGLHPQNLQWLRVEYLFC